MFKTVLLVITIFLSGCIGFLTELKKDAQISGNLVSQTVLIVEEDYSYKGYFVPKGVYYPNSQTTDGFINYIHPQRIKLVLLYGKGVDCSGGISVNSKAPYKDYKLFKYYDCGDPFGTYNVPKVIKFKIVPRNS